MKWLIGLLLCLHHLHATYEAPWIDLVLQPVGHFAATYQHFSRFASGKHTCPYPGRDLLLDAGIYYAHTLAWDAQIETRVTRTHAHGFAIDQFKETVRFALSDDAQGDPFASMVGFALTQPITIGLRDPSIIHHAHIEAEGHFALGKEWSAGPYWVYRTYGLGAFGFGDLGSPWLRGKLAFLRNIDNRHLLSIRMEGQKGFGHKHFTLHHFYGYGSIDYAFIQVAFTYCFQSDCGWLAALEFLQRLYSRNCPDQISQIRLELTYPFSF